jgi:hypothetical protein
MFELDTERLGRIIDNAHAIANHLAAMREAVSEDEWDAICGTPHVGPLLMLAMDLEFEVQG